MSRISASTIQSSLLAISSQTQAQTTFIGGGEAGAGLRSLAISSETSVLAIDVTERSSSRSTRGIDSESPSKSDLEKALQHVDPKAIQELRAILELLYRQDPEQAAAFARQFQHAVLGFQKLGGEAVDAAPQRGVVQEQRFSLAIEATITDIRAEIDENGTVSAEFVQVRFSANFERVQQQADPLVLDLNENGQFDVTRAEDGHDFDIRGDGRAVRTATTYGGDALLAWDRNGNGQIDDGRELFGDQNGAIDGFAELGRFDDNADGRIDRQDAIFRELLAYQDVDRNGRTDDGELQTLSSLGIERLLLATQATHEVSNGNQAILTSAFEWGDGRQGRIGDLLFNYLG